MTILRNIAAAAIIALLLLTFLGVLVQVGAIKDPKKEEDEAKSRRMRLDEDGPGYRIFTDRETGVCYLLPDKGDACIMVKHDGTPYLANGWRDVG